MPPKLDVDAINSMTSAISSLCKMNEDLLKQQLESMKSVGELTKSVAELTRTVAQLVTKQDVLLDRVVKLEESMAKNPVGKNPQSSSYSDVTRIVTRAIADQDVQREKSRRAVIERFPELDTEEATRQRDKQKIAEISQEIGVAADLVAAEIHRHGIRREDSNRIIKVPFRTTEARDKFIRYFNTHRKKHFPKAQADRIVTCRRDLTPLELEIHYAKLKECSYLNNEAGCYKYFYRDLEVFPCKEPRPFQKD